MPKNIAWHRFTAAPLSDLDRAQLTDDPASATRHFAACNACRLAHADQNAVLDELIDVVRVALVHGYAVTLRPRAVGYDAEVAIAEAREAFTGHIGPSRADTETPMRAARAAR